MVACGFKQLKYSASMYYHKRKDVKLFVHGDDIVVGAVVEMAKWYRARARPCPLARKR